MKKKILLVYIVLAAFLKVSIPDPLSYGALTNEDLLNREGIKVGAGNIAVHSACTVKEELDSNIFFDDSNTKFDAITILNPSAGIDVPLGDVMLAADYDTTLVFFGRYTEQDHIDHRVRGFAEVEFADYTATLKDVYRRFTDRSGSENTARIKQQTNELEAGIAGEFELFRFDAAYTNRIQDYRTIELVFGPLTYEDKSTMTHIFSALGNYRFLPKTFLLLESDLGLVRYYNSSASPGSWYVETLLGIRGEWLSRIAVNMKGGFRYQDYDASDLISSKPYAGPVARGGIDFYVTDDDTVTLGLEKAVFESTYRTMNYYDVNVVKLEYEHVFNDKLSANAAGSYQLNLYPGESTENGVTAKRYDNFFSAGCGVRYDIRKWVSVEAQYDYQQRISVFSVFDYKDHLLTIRGTVGF